MQRQVKWLQPIDVIISIGKMIDIGEVFVSNQQMVMMGPGLKCCVPEARKVCITTAPQYKMSDTVKRLGNQPTRENTFIAKEGNYVQTD